MEFIFKIYPNKADGHACKLIAIQIATDLDEAIDDATKILEVFKESTEVVFMIEHDNKYVAGISPEIGEWVKF